MAIDVVVDEVADNLEEIAQATRRINTTTVGYVLGGVAVGLVVGFAVGYRFNKEKIKAEAFRQSEAEVEKIRELYQQKTVAATPKPPVEEIIEERGYKGPEIAYDRPLKPPVPGVVEPVVVVPPPVVIVEETEVRIPVWNYDEELEKRVHGQPYIIHQDELADKQDEYNRVIYTYYAGDDVLVDEENGHPLPHADIVVGVENLKFGYGSDDENVVFVRNDRLELDMEICRTPDSYEEKILGLENSTPDEDE
jgi:hypothetical protein